MSKRNKQPAVTEAERTEIVEGFRSAVTNADYILAVDFEATCCDDGSFPRKDSEIIEFGFALIDNSQHRVVDTFTSFVKPQIQPHLTKFCTDLTSITQDDVDSAPLFKAVVKAVNDWLHTRVRMANKTMVWMSWGQYDFNQLIADCSKNRVANPLAGNSHFNLKRYESLIRIGQEQGLHKAVTHYGLKWHGVHHRGVDDAVNVANIYLKLSERW